MRRRATRDFEPDSRLCGLVDRPWRLSSSLEEFRRQATQTIAQTGVGKSEQHLVGEGLRQNAHGLGAADAAALQIEDLVLVQLADGRAVRALDVVGVDVEL